MLSKKVLIMGLHVALAEAVGVLSDPSKCTHSWRMYIDTLAGVAVRCKSLAEATTLIERIVFQRVSLNAHEVAKIVWSIRNASLPKPDVPQNVTGSVSESAVEEKELLNVSVPQKLKVKKVKPEVGKE